MPFAEFQPGNAGLALPQFQFQSGLQMTELGTSMMDRAQRFRMDQQRLENEKQQLASNLALNSKRVEEMNAQIAGLNTQAAGQRIENQIKAATSRFTIAAMDRASKLFGQGDGTPADSTEFQRDVAPLYGMNLSTPQEIADFKARLALVNGKYAALAHVHPAAKLMFDQALAPLAAKAEGASTLLTARAMTESKALETDLVSVKDSDGLNAFLTKNRDRHSVALLDPKYSELFATTAKDVRDKAATLANSRTMQEGSFANERRMLEMKSTVDIPKMGLKGIAPTPEAAQKVRDAASQYEPTVDALDELQRIAEEVQKDKTGKVSPALTRRAQIYQQQLISSIGKLQTGGVLQVPEAEVMKKLVPDPTKLLSLDGSTIAGLEALRHETEVRLNAVATSNQVARTQARRAGENVSDGASYLRAQKEAQARGLLGNANAAK